MSRPLVLHYAGCGTCKKALAWLRAKKIDVELRPIVEQPPTIEELHLWIPASGVPLRRWLNTSGQSYRAMGKERVDALSDADLMKALSRDGKLVKRPILVLGARAARVAVGFDEARYAELFR